MRIKTLLLALAVAIPAPALADKQTDKAAEKLVEADQKIIAHLHHVNLMEIDMGKLAQKRGTPAVKRYGDMLLRDHSASDKDVIALAKQKGLAKIPAAKPETEAEKAEHDKKMKDMAAMKKLKGSDFDREFLRMMVDGHDGELAKTPVFLADATDADLKTLLENRKTSLQRHADTARELQRGNTQAAK